MYRENIIEYDEENMTFELWFPYDYEQKEFAKTRLKARYNPDEKFWYVNTRVVDLELLEEYAEEFGAQFSAEALQAIDDLSGEFEEATTLATATDADISMLDLKGFEVDLFPFQRAGVKYAVLKKRAIIGDDMGLGKTYQSLAAFHALKLKRFIVVCPAGIKLNWQREIQKAMPGCFASVWDAKTGSPRADVVIINYDNLKKRLPDLFRFNAEGVIFDEVHYCKSGKAARTQAALSLAEKVPHVLGLTGTPIMNRPSELISILQMLGRLQDFGGWYQFAKRYCGARYNLIWYKPKDGGRARQKKILDVTGATNLQELNERLRAMCMIRRKKSEVLKELPQLRRASVVFNITNRDEYSKAATDVADFLAAAAASDTEFLKSIAMLSEVEQEYAIEERRNSVEARAKRAEQLVMIETLKQLACEGKMKAAIEWVRDFLESGEKLLIFTTHKDFQYDLLLAFDNAARIIAEDDIEQRQANVVRFANDETCRLMVASLQAGGTGIDQLQMDCSNVAFLELAWTPAAHLQAEGRLHRIGQNDGVTAWYLLAERTIDEMIQRMLAEKQAVCDSVLDGAPEVQATSVFDQLIETLSVWSADFELT